ncbi:hypothetical protein TTHERM_01435700 (macronuclear) [Tetrahymena thermophila SB210]|uniref:Uncharacterized protein n=1 Tax=Tetrahymena thermophila (strain SB210) TaxID=312017 RepID=Q229D1_TETTS|nr:hypothetical protein TTHERM_01435700 [Tetrahymena thermophila SB210]EAR81897.1 hypothetical protein TTHERM_01435700 [Tetrahymena thermophila SB210]|eukprot:XP_001029560.1 hypothetical protein TTHERM_01435700 [Tetrahymena thermophila SB210]
MLKKSKINNLQSITLCLLLKIESFLRCSLFFRSTFLDFTQEYYKICLHHLVI